MLITESNEHVDVVLGDVKLKTTRREKINAVHICCVADRS